MSRREPEIIDAEFFVVGEPKPKRPIAYLVGFWGVFVIYGLAIIAELVIGFRAG